MNLFSDVTSRLLELWKGRPPSTPKKVLFKEFLVGTILKRCLDWSIYVVNDMNLWIAIFRGIIRIEGVDRACWITSSESKVSVLKITLENTFSYQVQDKLFTLYAIVWIKGRIDGTGFIWNIMNK